MSDPVTISGIIELPQDEATLLLEAGWLFMEMKKWKEAEEVFSGVAALIPHSDVPLICLGNLHFGQGRYERALKFQREALARAPDSALARAHEGEALLFLGKKNEAKDALKEAIRMEPDGDAAQFAKSLLEAADAGVV